MKRNVLIIIVVSSLDIGFNVVIIEDEALLLFSCFRSSIGRLAIISTGNALKVANKRKS